MQRAMDETERRRDKQKEHNKLHGITPQGIVKRVADVLEGAYATGGRAKAKRQKMVADIDAIYKVDSGGDIWKQIEVLEKLMHQAAKDLEFEKAATLRDQITQLKTQAL